ncbi:ABC transporter ATP-binding protein [Microbacterium limosum]|uniref:ABC transporter ATP-binding protein n=1 Tax=Microbacterium limosum TaxID=3079935 RepID=A0AAU0MHS8_9MICO|nr:ABC transporter ATP-binding protein [Microbacterium sp. Y20]WOQ69808.1 ABC transporter ATP-binding protein [Microbacterium sp. Y20]
MTVPARPHPAVSDPPALAESPVLALHDVSITYPDAAAPAPGGVSLSVQAGEVVLVLGPSGSGKSTLTLAMNGLIPHSLPAGISGRIEVAGLDTTTTPVALLSTHVAMVFQDPDAQLVTGTVLDEVAFGPENLRLPVAEVLARAESALRRVGLWERRAENPERLSGGGRQRLAIACALAMGSGILVLDEPTANLDPAGIDDVYAALRDVVARGDRTIVLVEHNLDQAVALATRVVVLDAAGRLVADGPVDDVLRRRAAELHGLGVWLPTAALAALRLCAAGYPLDPLPLTPADLRRALESCPAPSARTSSSQPEEDAAPKLLSPAQNPPIAVWHAPPPDSEPLVRVRGLTVARGGRDILRGVDLDVQAGDFLAVVGANGAGKTTLVQAMAGVVPPPRRRVQVNGLDPSRADAGALSRAVGFVFQNPEHQFVAATVFDELALPLRLRRVSEAEITERVSEMLERFGLAGREASHPFLLSGGQKRRLSVGTALIAGAPVLALDEPTFGQDRARADELMSLLAELNAGGTTVIVVTHDMQLVAEYATRAAVLAGGRLLAHTSPTELFADADLLRRAGLRRPPLAEALRAVAAHPELDGIARLSDLPGGTRS